MAGETGSLDQLGIRIDKQEDVSKEDVEKAFETEKKSIIKKYEELGVKGESFEKKQYLDRLTALKDRLLQELEESKKSSEKKKVRSISEAMALRDTFKGKLEAQKNKHTQLQETFKKTRDVTDPRNDGAPIPDYEGYAWLPWEVGDMEDENVNNPTRWTLSGWLAAYETFDPALAKAELAKAVQLYKESNDAHWYDSDEVLNYQPMIQGMKMKQYLGQISQFKLGPEAEGYIAGLMSIADTQTPQDAQSYKDFILARMGEIHGSGGFNYTAQPGDEANETYDFNKGAFQIGKLEGIPSPKEWVERNNKVRTDFDSLKEKAYSLSETLGFNYADVRLRTFLAKSRDKISLNDEAEMMYATAQVRTEAFTHVGEMKESLNTMRAVLGTTLEGLVERNKTKERYKDADFEDVRRQLSVVDENLQKIKPGNTDTLEQLVTFKEPLNTAVSDLESIKNKINEMDGEINKAVEKKKEEEKPKEPESPPVVVTPSDSEKPPETVETVEKGTLEQFLREKNLVEHLEGEDYRYTLNTPRKVVVAGSQEIVFDNPEVDNLVGKKLNGYFRGLFTDKDVSDMEDELTLLKAKNAGIAEVFEVITKKVMKTFTPEEVARLNKIIEILRTAKRNSDLSFTTRPSYRAMTVEYNRKFIPAWESAGKELDAVLKNGVKPPQKNIENVDPLSGVAMPPELGFLGKVEPLYLPALTAMVLSGNNPDGATFDIPWDKGYIGCRFMPEPQGGYSLNFLGGRFFYPSIDRAALDLNSGKLHAQFMHNQLMDEKAYKSYEDQLGDVDELEKGRHPGEIHLELDWDNPDPDIYIRALPHGKIVYTINRENVGAYGEETRSGWAANFQDFMIQLRHIRHWAEQDDHPGPETVQALKEIRFNTISNPFNWSNAQVEASLGHMVGFGMGDNEVVQMYFDWSGGLPSRNPSNTMLNVWVENDGTLRYILNGPSVKVGATRAVDYQDVIQQVTALRNGSVLQKEKNPTGI